MQLFRAEYSTRTGTRHMTFCQRSLPDAERYAAAWAIDDVLVRVETVRECERPAYQLEAAL